MTVQNGHATASVSAPVATASRARSSLIWLPRSSSHMCAPPAPQQNVRSSRRAISSGLPTAETRARGSAMTSLCRAEVARVVVGDRLVAGGWGFSLPSRTSSDSSWVWWITSYWPPKSEYSRPSVLKQCGQVVTIRVTFAPLSVSTLRVASDWKVYSSPMRRAGSPVHDSRGPRIAKSTPASISSFAVERAPVRARSSKAGAQPTQKSTSGGGSPGSSDPDVQARGPVRPFGR